MDISTTKMQLVLLVTSAIVHLSPLTCAIAFEVHQPRDFYPLSDDVSFEELSSISADINSEYPTDFDDLNSIIASANSIYSDVATAYPSLTISSIPQYTEVENTGVPTAGVYTGPYVSNIAQTYSSFIETRTPSQQFSVQGMSLLTFCQYRVPPQVKTQVKTMLNSSIL